MVWIKNKLNISVDILVDILKIMIIEYMPNKLFQLCYFIGLFNSTRLKMYTSPKFNLGYLKDLDLRKESQKILQLSTQLLNNNQPLNYALSPQEESESIVTEKRSHFKFAKIIIPKGWSDPETVGGRTQGPQIQFLKSGLMSCGLQVEIIEVVKNTNDSLVDDNLDVFLAYKEEIDFSIIFIWSLTQIDPRSKAFNSIREMKKAGGFRGQIIGVNTASPYQKFFSRFKEWSEIMNDLIFYEEKSRYKLELEKMFRVIHMPIIQISDKNPSISTDIVPSVHSSCLLKQNRLSWLIVLKFICLRLNYKYFIRAISYPLSWKNLHDTYQSINEIASERSKYMLGFIMVHREPDLDCHLIGSFWDYYRLGVIPIVQMQELSDFAKYMTPYLDYFPVVSELDLYLVLKISQENPEHFTNLQKRIQERMEFEFNPKNVVCTMLENFDIEL